MVRLFHRDSHGETGLSASSNLPQGKLPLRAAVVLQVATYVGLETGQHAGLAAGVAAALATLVAADKVLE